MISYLILVDPLPTTTYDNGYYGANLVASPSGERVYLQHNEHFYIYSCVPCFNCNATKVYLIAPPNGTTLNLTTICKWHEMEQKLTHPVTRAVMMQLPGEYTCLNSTLGENDI